MILSIIKVLFYFSILTPSSEACVLSKEIVELGKEIDDIEYMRVHPSGKYILYTGSYVESASTKRTKGGGTVTRAIYGRNVQILELVKTDGGLKTIIHQTPLMREAFPVEPNWEFISSPYHDDGTMKYYNFQDLISKGSETAQPVYSSEFNEFYHSIGGSNNEFTMTRWNFLGSKTFKINKDNGAVNIKESPSIFLMCSNLIEWPESLKPYKDFINNDEIKIRGLVGSSHFDSFYDSARETIAASYKNKGIDIESLDRKAAQQVQREVQKLNLKVILNFLVENNMISRSQADKHMIIYSSLIDDEGFFDKLDGMMLTKPILSKDAKYISGVYKGETRVYKINEDKTCSEVASLGAEVSKASFSYPGSFKNELITFYAQSAEDSDSVSVHVFDPVTQETILLDSIRGANLGFPGFTKDGRVMYISKDKLVIATLDKNADGTLKRNCAGSSEDAKAKTVK